MRFGWRFFASAINLVILVLLIYITKFLEISDGAFNFHLSEWELPVYLIFEKSFLSLINISILLAMLTFIVKMQLAPKKGNDILNASMFDDYNSYIVTVTCESGNIIKTSDVPYELVIEYIRTIQEMHECVLASYTENNYERLKSISWIGKTIPNDERYQIEPTVYIYIQKKKRIKNSRKRSNWYAIYDA